MNARIVTLLAFLSLITLVWAQAQDQPAQLQQPRPRRAAAPEAAGPAGPLVTLEIALVDRQVGGDSKEGAAVPSAADLLQLEKQSKLDRVMRVRLSSVAGNVAKFQLGERVPRVTGRNPVGRGGFGGAAGRGAGGADAAQPTFTYSYTLDNIGTLISANTRVEEAGTVIVDLQVERSRLRDVPKPADEEPGAVDVGRQKIISLTSQSTLRLKPGEPALAEGFQSAGDDARGEYIVVTAHVESGPARSAAAEKRDSERQIRVYHLATSKASDIAPMLQQMLGDKGLRFGVDEATNSLIASGSPDQIAVAEDLLKRLDESKK